jgi:hypothetical protein
MARYGFLYLSVAGLYFFPHLLLAQGPAGMAQQAQGIQGQTQNPNILQQTQEDNARIMAEVSQLQANQAPKEADFQQTYDNGLLANEGWRRCRDYVRGWLNLADPATGLIPRNTKDRFWNAQDAAADNYAFMVLSSWFTDEALFHGRMLDMLKTETRLTSRIGQLPDSYDFNRQGFRTAEANLTGILFGASEYIKDGLLPVTEWLGPSPWSQRMLAILDDMWARAPVDTPFGKIVSDNVEINGEMLQTLSRVYWMTGQERYLEWALRLGDYHLLGDHHPTRDLSSLRLRDHGCEIVSGLCELYACAHFARPAKKKAYEEPIHMMLRRILEVGRNQRGLFYNVIDPRSGTVRNRGVADTWGYTLNGYYTVYLIDKTKPYRRATLEAMNGLNQHYRNYAWEGSSSDGYADSLESALNLYNREAVPSVAQWLDSETQVMWTKQKPDGTIEGWHGDGNFARTTLMYCLWKTQGLSLSPWREDVIIGAERDAQGRLQVAVSAKRDWTGRIRFDVPRHRVNLKLPLDWPRINQFPEWFTVDPDQRYQVRNIQQGRTQTYLGQALHNGLALTVSAGEKVYLTVMP